MTKDDLKKNPAKGVRWDLSDLYQSPEDPKIDQDFRNALTQAQKFEKKYRGKINFKDLDVETLLKAVQEQERIYETILRPWFYAELVFLACSNQTNSSFSQKMQRRYTETESYLLFFESEWISLDDNLAEKLLADKKLAKYRHFLENKRLYKPYQLSEPEEKIIREKSITGVKALRGLFLETVASIHYKMKIDGKVIKLSQKEILDLAKHHHSRRMRRRANKVFAAGLKANAKLITFIFNMLAQDKVLEDKLRGYPHPLKERNLRNEVEDDSVIMLLKVGKDNHDIVEKYYRLKGKILGVRNLKEIDVYVSVFPETEERITFEDCKRIVLESYNEFSPLMGRVVEKFFQNHWIDAELREGKYQSAFCMECTPSVHPYLLLNFTGTLADIRIATHEAGHGIREYLARSQGVFNFYPPPPEDPSSIVLGEIPSIFGEILTFENLKKKVKNDKVRLKLLARTIENSFATFFRQIALTRFELMLHQGVRKEGNLSTEKINRFWKETIQDMFGKALTLTKDYDCCWMYIPHFVNTPFYCYAYAFSFLLVMVLYSRWQEEGQSFVPKYLEFLKIGRSIRPQEALKIVDIDLADPNFWQSGVDVLRNWVKEAEELAKSLGLV